MDEKESESETDISSKYIILCKCVNDLISWQFTVINILIFETTAMAFLSYNILRTEGVIGYPSSIITFFTMFFSFLWTGRFTGTFLNPSVVIACMIKKQKKVPIIKGIIYLLSQFVGAFIGTFIAWAINDNLSAPFELNPDRNQVIQIFCRQILGSFLYTFLVLILVSSDTTFVQMDIQIWLTIPLILITVSLILNLPLAVNSAWSLSYQVAWIVHHNRSDLMQYCWIFIAGPVIGGILSGLFFEFLFRRFVLAYKVQLKRKQQMFLERMNQLEIAKGEFQSRYSMIQLF